MVGAFTNHQIGMLAVWSLLYGSAFLLVALWIFHIRMRLHRDAN
jgi:type VI protein secretion system component VasF